MTAVLIVAVILAAAGGASLPVCAAFGLFALFLLWWEISA